jgi:hypothetical protein
MCFGKTAKGSTVFLISACTSTSSNSTPSGRMFIKFNYFSRISRDNSSYFCLTRITGTLNEALEDLWYLIDFFLIWEIFQRKYLKQIKIYFLFNNIFPKSNHLWDDVEKYGRPGQATDDNIRVRMRFPCWSYGVVLCTTYTDYFTFRAKDFVKGTRSLRN